MKFANYNRTTSRSLKHMEGIYLILLITKLIQILE